MGKAEREGREGGKKGSHHPNQQLPGSNLEAPVGAGRAQRPQGRGLCSGKGLLSEAQVRLLVGLHYLPHEHGPSAKKLLQDLTWLKTNCHLVGANSKKALPQKVSEGPLSLMNEILIASLRNITLHACFCPSG